MSQKRVTKKRKRASTRRLPTLLLVECDSPKLASQNLSLANHLDQFLGMFTPSTAKRSLLVQSQSHLLAELASCTDTMPRCDIITLIGHSNQQGLRMAGDMATTANWTNVASWFEPFRPKTLILVGCQAGSWLPCSALFNGISSLTDIYGSPAKLSGPQTKWVYALLPFLLRGGKSTDDRVAQASLLTFMLTGAAIFRRTRTEFQRNQIETAIRWTIIDTVVRAALKS